MTVNRAQVSDASVSESRFQVEKDLLISQNKWISWIEAVFRIILGWVSGMSIMHIILIALVQDAAEFIKVYSPFALVFNGTFLLFTSLSLVFGIAISMIYR